MNNHKLSEEKIQNNIVELDKENYNNKEYIISIEYAHILKSLKIPWYIILCRLLHLSLIIYIFSFIINLIFAINDLFFLTIEEIPKNIPETIKLLNKYSTSNKEILDSFDQIKNIYDLTIYTHKKRKEIVKYQFIYICVCAILCVILSKFTENNNFKFTANNILNVNIKICKNYLENFFSKLLYINIPFIILILFFLHLFGRYISISFICVKNAKNTYHFISEKNVKIFIFGIFEENFLNFLIASFKKAFFYFNHTLIYLFILLCTICITFYIELPLIIVIFVVYFFFLQQLLDFNYQSLSLNESIIKINNAVEEKYNIFYLFSIIDNNAINLFNVNLNKLINHKDSNSIIDTIQILSNFVMAPQFNTYNSLLTEIKEDLLQFSQLRTMFLLKFFFTDLNYTNYILNRCFLNNNIDFTKESDNHEIKYMSLEEHFQNIKNAIKQYKNKSNNQIFYIIFNDLKEICNFTNNNDNIFNILKHYFNYDGMILPYTHLSDISLFWFIIKLIPFYFYLIFFCPYIFFVRSNTQGLNTLYYYQKYFTKIYYININFKNAQYIPLYHENGEIIGGLDIIKNSFNITIIIDDTLEINNKFIKIKNFLILYGPNSDAIINTFFTHDNVNFMTDYGLFVSSNVKYQLNKMIHTVDYNLGVEDLSKIFLEYNDVILKDILIEILRYVYPLLLERMNLQFNLLSGGQKIICAITKALLHVIKKLMEFKKTNIISQLSIFIIPYINGLDPQTRERLYTFLTKKLSVICGTHDIPTPFIIMTTNKLDDHLISDSNPFKDNIYIANGNFLPFKEYIKNNSL